MVPKELIGTLQVLESPSPSLVNFLAVLPFPLLPVPCQLPEWYTG